MIKFFNFLIVYSLFMILTACDEGGDVSDSPSGPKDTTPPGQISNLSMTKADNQVVLSWTNPNDADFDGVLIRMSVTTYPLGPNDGTEVYKNNGNTYTATSLTNGIIYYFSVFAYDFSRNYAEAVKDEAIPVDTINPNPVASFAAFIGDRQINLTWTNPVDNDYSKVIIRRLDTDYPGLSEGVLVYDGSGNSCLQTSLTNGVTYYYSAFSVDDDGLYSTSAQVNGTPADDVSPNQVSDLVIDANDEEIMISWTNPLASDFSHVIIRKSEIDFPAIDEGTEVFNNSTTSFSDTSLTNGTTYYYSLFSCDDDDLCSAGAQISAIPADTGSPGQVTNLVGTPGNQKIKIDWVNPSDSDLVGIMIRRSETAFPGSVSEGTEVFNSLGTTFSDSVLSNGTTYFYSIFTYDEVPNYSLGSTVKGIPVVGLSDTGQTGCWGYSGISKTCDGSGEDGDYISSIQPSFTNNLNGTITDNVTGLIWQRCPYGTSDDNCSTGLGSYPNWTNAISYCNSSTTAGITNWRLPSTKELISIMNYQYSLPAQDITYFPYVANYLWTSDEYSSTSAIIVSTNTGDATWGLKSREFPYYTVRCVSGTEKSSSFTDNSNGTITDNSTGLMWQKCPRYQNTDSNCSGTAIETKWSSDMQYCENLTLLNQSDWRLPNIKELVSLIDYTKSPTRIDETYFPNTGSFDFTSSTTNAGYTESALSVTFNNGFVWDNGQLSFRKIEKETHVRCVRGGL